MRSPVLLALLLVLTVPTSAAAQEDQESPEAFLQRFEEVINAGNAVEVAAMYRVDGRDFHFQHEISGRDNIRINLQRQLGAMAEKGVEPEFRFTVKESWVDGDTAMVWFDLVLTDEKIGELMAFWVVLRLTRDGRSWKIARGWWAS